MNFVKTTLIGGIVFLVPVTVCVLILAKAYDIMTRLAAPAAEWLPVHTVAGVAMANLLALVAIVLICFLAGLVSRSRLASRLVRQLETRFLNTIPGYAFIKGVTGGLVGVEDKDLPVPVLARFDDAWQLAFCMDQLSDGRVVLFIPSAPDPWPGSLLIMDEARIQRLDRSAAEAVTYLRALGRGSRELLPTSTT